MKYAWIALLKSSSQLDIDSAFDSFLENINEEQVVTLGDYEYEYDYYDWSIESSPTEAPTTQPSITEDPLNSEGSIFEIPGLNFEEEEYFYQQKIITRAPVTTTIASTTWIPLVETVDQAEIIKYLLRQDGRVHPTKYKCFVLKEMLESAKMHPKILKSMVDECFKADKMRPPKNYPDIIKPTEKTVEATTTETPKTIPVFSGLKGTTQAPEVTTTPLFDDIKPTIQDTLRFKKVQQRFNLVSKMLDEMQRSINAEIRRQLSEPVNPYAYLSGVQHQIDRVRYTLLSLAIDPNSHGFSYSDFQSVFSVRPSDLLIILNPPSSRKPCYTTPLVTAEDLRIKIGPTYNHCRAAQCLWQEDPDFNYPKCFADLTKRFYLTRFGGVPPAYNHLAESIKSQMLSVPDEHNLNKYLAMKKNLATQQKLIDQMKGRISPIQEYFIRQQIQNFEKQIKEFTSDLTVKLDMNQKFTNFGKRIWECGKTNAKMPCMSNIEFFSNTTACYSKNCCVDIPWQNSNQLVEKFENSYFCTRPKTHDDYRVRF